MKKGNVSINYDDEKLRALKIYMNKKGTDFDSELEKALDLLYVKYVPANVREFFELKSSPSSDEDNNGL